MGDEAFRQLSAVDPKGNELLDKVGVSPVFHVLYNVIISNIQCNIICSLCSLCFDLGHGCR